MEDSFEQSSKAIRRRNGPIHHCEVLVVEKRNSAMSGEGRGTKGESRKLRRGHGKLVCKGERFPSEWRKGLKFGKKE